MTSKAIPTSKLLPPERVARLTGFGMTSAADGYVYRPTCVDEIREVLDLARQSGRRIVQRGAGQSYGDANIGAECIVLDMTRMRRTLAWDAKTGIIEVEAGVTVEGLWRQTLEDGYWPPVVSGTMMPTLGGALAMNIHGKNNYCQGPIGEHVLEIDLLDTKGNLRTLTPKDDAFYAVISGAGLLGIVTRVKLQMKKIGSGDVRVLPVSCANLNAQFQAFEKFEHDADYMVSWIDCFGGGGKLGRGLFHAAWYTQTDGVATLRPEHQDLPDTILGMFPKSVVWRFLKMFCNRFLWRQLNWAKHTSSKLLGDGKSHSQSLVGFSFLLDYVPNWRWAYRPGGFIQYQSFVPKEHAKRVFDTQITMQQEAGLESFLGVMKRHRPDKFLFSHAVDGYSLALDFKVTKGNWQRLQALAHRMNDLVLEAGGRFYFAKDSTLRRSDLQAFLGEEAIERFRGFKRELDPEGLLTSQLAERVGLV